MSNPTNKTKGVIVAGIVAWIISGIANDITAMLGLTYGILGWIALLRKEENE